MKFIYGKRDWSTFERGEENCYLMTNGLGGFSSLSLIGSCSRNDQAVLMTCVHSPNHRYNMIHRLEEILFIGDKSFPVSSQDYQCSDKRENGYLYQTRFTFEDYPQWSYLINGVELTRTIVLMQGKNTLGISYEIRNRSGQEITLRIAPHLQFVPKGARLSKNQKFVIYDSPVDRMDGRIYTGGRISSAGQDLHFKTNGEWQEVAPRFCDTLRYAHDISDGKMALGRSAVTHEISFTLAEGAKDTLDIIYSTDSCLPPVSEMIQEVVAYRNHLKEQAGFEEEAAQMLSVSADQFISYRASTARQTILAGFPFFEDWGRDTMIALMGCCLSTRQFDTAESILRTFMLYCKNGLMPNLFPEGKEEPGYNTADAALLFIVTVYEFFQKTHDKIFVQSAYPVMKEIIDWYRKGTDFGIKMDEDGLIMAGKGYDQVTWMDVRVENILPTPRHGKPVEINAYWYNALRIMERFRKYDPNDNTNYGAMADQVKESFEKLFWNEKTGCLKDVISGTDTDDQIRCNQIWAVSLPFSLLSAEKEKQVVEIVFRKLYTPYGLRTLDPEDAQFRPFYGGAQLDRDLAYHQGTVWTFPLGGYYLAYLKVNEYSDTAREYVREQLHSIEAALWEGCIGQLPEIYDGENPISSKGCFAQAWSVGEILRVYDALRSR